MEQAFIVRSVRQMSSVEVISRWISQETVLEQGFPSLTSTTVRISGYFFYLNSILRKEACHPFTCPCVFIPYGVLHAQVSPTDPRTTGIACIRLIKDLREGGGVFAEARMFLSPLLPRDV
uniref:Uncharacterized protein LOC111107953 n=1 Tax=Crassostrea virginica TaxID=6565 RepID=A0A8B8B7R2_CRAVI|nr:uncharacterized protein LOC111107953 [Crassostrea virginica]